jgi:2-keto-4-pentenoate hydratase
LNSSNRFTKQRSAARWLVDAYARRADFAPLPQKIAPRSLAEAYTIQADYVHQKGVVCGPSVGRKIALSSVAMQTMTGLPAPISGRLHRNQVVGSPAGVRPSDYGRLSINELAGEAFINGVSVGKGQSADLMQGPLHALAWLANQAAGMGDPLRAGEIAILGSMITSKFPRAGDRIEYRLEGFPPVVLQA